METQRMLTPILAIIAAFTLCHSAIAGGSLAWEQTLISEVADFGQDEVNVFYSFTNNSEGPITITKTQASCGCTVPSLEKDTYAPGESGKLLATFDIGNRVGMQHKEITVETSEPGGAQSYVLTLNVDIPQLLQLKRRALLWKVGDKPDTKDCEIIIHATRPMTIDEVVLKNGETAASRFQFEIVELVPKQKYLLKVTPKNMEEKIRETCYLSSPDDTKKHLRSFPIYAWIR